jgi:hypothetical protein
MCQTAPSSRHLEEMGRNPSSVFCLNIPAVSVVMKDLDRFDVISLASFSESLDNLERCLPTPWLLREALPCEALWRSLH